MTNVVISCELKTVRRKFASEKSERQARLSQRSEWCAHCADVNSSNPHLARTITTCVNLAGDAILVERLLTRRRRLPTCSCHLFCTMITLSPRSSPPPASSHALPPQNSSLLAWLWARRWARLRRLVTGAHHVITTNGVELMERHNSKSFNQLPCSVSCGQSPQIPQISEK